jgi:hypothetical protein
MRDILRNPIAYYLAAPLLVAIWPLLVWGVYLPRAEQDWDDDKAYYLEGQTHIVDILRMDPDRLDMVGDDEVGGEFSYATAFERAANLCNIPASRYNYSMGPIMESGGKRRQQCKLELDGVSIVQAASFLTRLQSTWVNLSCDKAKLEQRQELPDRWEVSMTFYYYY